MIANYGYSDGSGFYYITIDTGKCMSCVQHPCVAACPQGLFAVEPDDYDDMAAFVKRQFQKEIKYKCAACKPVADRPSLPCVKACPGNAITHSW